LSGWPHLDLVTILIFLSEQNVISNVRIWIDCPHESSRKLSHLSKKNIEVIWTSRTRDMGWTLNNVWAVGQIRTSSLLLQFRLGNGLFKSWTPIKVLGLCLSFHPYRADLNPRSTALDMTQWPNNVPVWTESIFFLSLDLSLSFQFQYLNSSINPFIYVIGLHSRWTFTIN